MIMERARFKGSVIIGIILVAVSTIIFIVNENKRSDSKDFIAALGREVQHVDSRSPDAKNDGRVVHLSGRLSSPEKTGDPSFLKPLPVLKLQRNVEMLQWKEISDGSRNARYSYELSWSDSMINSSSFHIRDERYQNPREMPLANEIFTAGEISLGAFDGKEIIDRLVPEKRLELRPDMLKNPGLKIEDNYIYPGRGNSSIGDSRPGRIRIRYSFIEPGDYSVIARQVRSRFLEPVHDGGTETVEISRGIRSAGTMVLAMETRSRQQGIFIRVLGFLLMFGGFYFILKRLTFWTTAMPIVGKAGSLAVFIVSGVLSLALSALFIILGMLMVHPILLGIVAICMIVLYAVLAGRKTEANAE